MVNNPGQLKAWQSAAGILAAFIVAAMLDGTHVGDSGAYGTVLLGTPINMSIEPDSTINFTYYPTVANGTFHHIELWTNETGIWAKEEENTSNLVNNTLNWIEHRIL